MMPDDVCLLFIALIFYSFFQLFKKSKRERDITLDTAERCSRRILSTPHSSTQYLDFPIFSVLLSNYVNRVS